VFAIDHFYTRPGQVVQAMNGLGIAGLDQQAPFAMIQVEQRHLLPREQVAHKSPVITTTGRIEQVAGGHLADAFSQLDQAIQAVKGEHDRGHTGLVALKFERQALQRDIVAADHQGRLAGNGIGQNDQIEQVSRRGGAVVFSKKPRTGLTASSSTKPACSNSLRWWRM
jgi:hypothetical protein